MDRIDSFIIHAQQKVGVINFQFIIIEEDIPKESRNLIIDYIERFVNTLNLKIPQFKFSWSEAHKIKPKAIYGEIIHQILVQMRFN